MHNPSLIDKCRGSLVGGAAGDALGYAVEFDRLYEIRLDYGDAGIHDYRLHDDGLAIFSDDTQMTLFTAEGLLAAIADGKTTVREILPFIRNAYLDWFTTQTSRMGESLEASESPGLQPTQKGARSLLSEPRLWARRAPGTTCMSAMAAVKAGHYVLNDSKGCGGVMRVAPIGIFAGAHPQQMSVEEAGRLAGRAAEITHLHPLSTLSSMALAMIVARCILSSGTISRANLRAIVLDTLDSLADIYPANSSDLSYLTSLVNNAMTLAMSDVSDTAAIRHLGEGWVAEETLAIAIFSVMRHIDNFEACLVCAVNHDGDSDSTGAVAGNILGAHLGYDAIPQKYKDSLELLPLLIDMADRLGS